MTAFDDSAVWGVTLLGEEKQHDFHVSLKNRKREIMYHRLHSVYLSSFGWRI